MTNKLDLPPTSPVVLQALTHLADRILENDGQPVPRDAVEQESDSYLPGRIWPTTLFQQLASEGLTELRPTYDGTEVVGFPFQAYSEHFLAVRLLELLDAKSRSWADPPNPLPPGAERRHALAERIAEAPWSWRSLAVVLPEKEGGELIDLLPTTIDDYRLQEATRESLIDRSASSFGARALELLRQHFTAAPGDDASGVETVLALAPWAGHPGNADWLHARLVGQSPASVAACAIVASPRTSRNQISYFADGDKTLFGRLFLGIDTSLLLIVHPS